MSEPTIDEMQNLLRQIQEDFFTINTPKWGKVQDQPASTYLNAICVILEGQREYEEMMGELNDEDARQEVASQRAYDELALISAFIERVSARHSATTLLEYADAVREELAELEKACV